MDVLADVLAASGVRGVAGARIEAGADWGWWAGPSPRAALHLVTSGVVWFGVPGEAPRQLVPGDVVLLPTGAVHTLASDPDALARVTGPEAADGYEELGPGVVRLGRGEARAHVLCAHYAHDPAVATPLLSLLPELVHVHARGSADDGLDDVVRLLARELARPAPATSVVLDRLVDVLLVHVLRGWLAECAEPETPTCLGILRDPLVGEAVSLLHADPARPWTTALLADQLHVSRATLARRFPAVTGETPAAYLTRWRMDLAARRLRDSDDPLDAIAASVGYTSAHAFNRAFARARSTPPGRFRHAARQPVAADAG